MISWLSPKRSGPIGVDIGRHSVKLLQFNHDASRLLEASRWDLQHNEESDEPPPRDELIQALRRAKEGRNFRGRQAVACLDHEQLFLQNIRVPKGKADQVEQAVRQEAAERLPFPISEAEIRYLEAGDVRQGQETMREVVLLACHKPVLEQLLNVFDEAGLQPHAVDIQPLAMLRAYGRQFRRDEDQLNRNLFIHVGYTRSTALIAEGTRVLFVKHLEVGGRHLDKAVAGHLNLGLDEASALRRHNGDRRSDVRDPLVAQSVTDATRGVLNQLAAEIAMCLRYYSVTFRGRPLARAILAGGEASPALCHTLNQRLETRTEVGDPLRDFSTELPLGSRSQWDVATGLALKELA